MKKTRLLNKWIGLSIVCLTALSLSWGCAATNQGKADTKSAIPQKPVLRIGTSAHRPPLVFKKGGRIVGLEADLAKALAEHLGMTGRFFEFEWNDLIDALLDNKIDIIMSGMSITNTRKVRITFSYPYLVAGQMALVPRTSLRKYRSVSSIKESNVKVGVEKGTTGDFLVQEEFPFAHRVAFVDPDKAVKAIEEERIDMFIHDAPTIWWAASVREDSGYTPVPIFLTSEELAWGIRYDDTDLLKAANGFIETWKRDGRLKASIKKWIPYAN